MSSLAGALDEGSIHSRSPRKNQDVAMDPFSDDDEDMDDDLFGNDNEVTDYGAGRASPTTSASRADSERLASPERERRQALEYEEDDNAPEVAYEVKEAEVSFPNIPVPRSSDGDKWVMRTPNFVQIDSKPFHPDTYIGPEQDEDEDISSSTNVNERSMSIKLKVEHTLRWRWNKDGTGQDYQQSNSRIIRWSDGSLSLRLGKELFDITQSVDASASVPRQLGASQSQSQSQAAPSARNQGLTYLVAQHKRSQVLQAEAVITGNMTLRPTGMQSESHRMLVRAVGQKHNKVARLKMTEEPTQDPERERAELAKLSNKKPKKREFDDGLGGVKRRKRRFADSDVWSDDDEEDEGRNFGSDGEGSSPRKAKRKNHDDDDERGGYQEDDFLVADSDEDDGGSSKKKRKSDRMDEEDPLDKLDAKIEAQSRGRDLEDSDEDKPMDVESEEEDEEDAPVRRPAGGTRRRAVNMDDEDEEE